MSVSASSKDPAGDYFVESVLSSYVLPLREELAREVEGYERMDYDARFAHVIALNAPHYGVGDCLPLGRALVFAGVQLGKEVIVATMMEGEFPGAVPVLVKQYQPRFSDRQQLRRSYALAPDDSILPPYWVAPDGSAVPRPGASSRLHEFLTRERETYEALPAAYRAALLALYLGARIMAPPEQIVEFILGGGTRLDAVQIQAVLGVAAYSYTPAYNAFGRAEGWHIRLRDSKPSNEIRDALFTELRSLRAAPLDWGDDEQIEREREKRRAPHKGPEAACEWLYEYEQQVLIPRGEHLGNKGPGKRVPYGDAFAKMPWELRKHYEDDDKDPESLYRQYRRFKARKGYE